MKISNFYIGVIERIYQNDFGRTYQNISSLPERLTVLYKEEDSNLLEDLKYGGRYPIGAQKNSGIGSSFVRPDSLIPMFKIEKDMENQDIEKEKVLMLFHENYQRGE